MPKSEYRARVSEMLDVVRLSEFAQRKPAQLSGGQQQRVALARALVNYPSALLLDEPLAALDLKLREAMQLELKRIQREVEITFVFVTHDQGEALTMSDRIAVMSQGRIEQIGTPEEIYHSPSSLFVAGFIGSANLLPGEVTGIDGDDAIVALRAGGSLRARATLAPRIGDRVSIMLRPERLIASTTAAPDGRSVAGTVRELIFQGASTRLEIALADGSKVIAQSTGDTVDTDARPGDDLHLRWSPGAAYMIDDWPTIAGATSSDVDEVEASL
jgi:spermidine/putrescine transport system ATP-binding protein